MAHLHVLEQDPLDQIIAQFYRGVLAPDAWSSGLAMLASLAGSEHAAITTWNRKTNRADISESVGLPENCLSDYIEHYCELDPARVWVDKLPICSWYVDHHHVGAKMMQRSAFYPDFMQKHGLSSLVAIKFLKENSVESFLVIQHGTGLPYDKQIDPHHLSRLIPHIRQAVKIRLHIEYLAGQAAIAEAALNQIQLPLIVCDQDGRIQYANSRVESLLQMQLVLAVQDGCILARDRNAKQLAKLIRLACGAHGPASAGGVRLGMDALNDLQIIVTPLPLHLGNIGQAHASFALILIHDPAMPLNSHELVLKQIYGLSMAEARVTIALAGGATPAEIALQLGVSMSTIRSQLKAVFRKTGTARQTELLRLLSALFIANC
ncbi:helix-turn-helix transcriptional regulator [Undibacterium sp. JH2W]|uniref:helix-turn-helix transcriptional regulator n=1 Tax=Undibacterium sp. JH2W TaxID=3413037 RepID=UPI003BF0499C